MKTLIVSILLALSSGLLFSQEQTTSSTSGSSPSPSESAIRVREDQRRLIREGIREDRRHEAAQRQRDAQTRRQVDEMKAKKKK